MKYILCLLSFLLPLNVWAADNKPVSPRIDQTIRSTFADMPIKSIRTTPIVGLYELVVGDTIYYADKTGGYLINGHMFDTRNKTDLTALRLASLSRISWADLPLKDAIVSGPKKGKKIAVFTDPDCPYCKKLEQQLGKANTFRVYTFLFPLTSIHPQAFAKSESIWCSKNQHQALVDVMVDGKTLKAASCKTPVKSMMELGAKLNVRGTPTIFVEDGRKFPGGSTEQLQKFIDQGV
ncbi:MAG: DsbC family protein [Mariprofundaceae bacterium]|nr:DsbC family protein [Mariprofundaceae bacterium]